MRLVETEGDIRAGAGVLKMRGSAHDTALREYRITDSGLEVATPLVGLAGVLSGTPTSARKEVTEEILQPLAFIEGRPSSSGTRKTTPRRTPVSSPRWSSRRPACASYSRGRSGG